MLKPRRLIYAKADLCRRGYSAATREGRAANVAKAEEYGKEVLLSGHVPVIPHKISSHWDEDPRLAELFGHVEWLELFCYPLLQGCHAIYLYPGWEHSKGATMEHAFAKAHGIPIVHTVEELQRLFG